MPLYPDNFKNDSSTKLSQNSTLSGVDIFLKILEKDFFSRVTVRQRESNPEKTSLIIELTCEISLAELLFHFNREAWGHFKGNESTLSIALDHLREVNNHSMEIEELSLFLKDTSIIIDGIYKDGIAKQFKNILIELGNHYVHLTKGLKEVPYEIYLPVIDGQTHKDNMALASYGLKKITSKEYYKYWGLYFESEEDALIYDLENIAIISGDLYMNYHQ